MRLAKPDLLLLAPGPINRGVELTPEVADGRAIGDPRPGDQRPGRADGRALLAQRPGRPRPGTAATVVPEVDSCPRLTGRYAPESSPCRRSRSAAAGSSTRARASTRSATCGSAEGGSCPAAAGTTRPRSVIDATGLIVCPGLIDMPRPPARARQRGGRDDRHGRRRRTGRRRDLRRLHAQHGPAIDTQGAAEFVVLQAQRAGKANVYPVGAVSARAGRARSWPSWASSSPAARWRSPTTAPRSPRPR